MYKFPIKIPNNLNLILAQSFHVAAPVDISQALQVQTTDHLGVDVVCGTNEQTWGQECVWPFPWPGIVYDAQVDSTYNARIHAHSQIDTTDPATGIQYSLIYLHLSSVTKTKTDLDSTVIIYNQGDVIGKIGNNGEVKPMPTPARPLDGTHLHLGMGVKKPGDLNFIMQDPLTMFDLNQPFRTLDTTPTPVPTTQNTDLSPADRLAIVAAQIQASGNTAQAKIVWAVVAFLRVFGG